MASRQSWKCWFNHNRRVGTSRSRARLSLERLEARLALAVVNDLRDLEFATDENGNLDVDPTLPGQQVSLRAALEAGGTVTISDDLPRNADGTLTFTTNPNNGKLRTAPSTFLDRRRLDGSPGVEIVLTSTEQSIDVAGGASIRGVSVVSNTGLIHRQIVTVSNGSTFSNNYIGLSRDGMSSIGANGDALVVSGTGTTISGNVISRGTDSAVIPTATFDSSGHSIFGNFFNTDRTGNAVLAGIVRGEGVRISTNFGVAGEAPNVIGGSTNGLVVDTADVVIANTHVGIGADGVTPIGNDVGVTGSRSFELVRNVISGNVTGAVINDSVRIVGNRIGTDAEGKLPVGNTTGLRLTTFVGTAEVVQVSDNFISGNSVGIQIDQTRGVAEILGNRIGIGVDDPNTGEPIEIGNLDGIRAAVTRDNVSRIGGLGAGEGNVIRNNVNGIVMNRDALIRIQGNEIFDNSHMGIDHVISGFPTEVGPNTIGRPVLTSARIESGELIVTGNFRTLNRVNGTFTLDFYANKQAKTANLEPDEILAGFDEGETYLGSTEVNVTTETFSFDYEFQRSLAGLSDVNFITATATLVLNGGEPLVTRNTSEFANALPVDAPAEGDLLVKKSDENDGLLLGDDVLATIAGVAQTISATSFDGRVVTYDIRIQNDGLQARTFLLKRANVFEQPNATARYFAGDPDLGAPDVIDQIRTTGFTTPNIQPGEFFLLRVEVDVDETLAQTGDIFETGVILFDDEENLAAIDAVKILTTFGLVVNVEDDTVDADGTGTDPLGPDGAIDVDLNKSGDQISLRAAITAANEGLGGGEIRFNIPKDGNIRPVIDVGTVLSVLPAFENLKILGHTQPGANMVELDGTAIKNRTPGSRRGLGDLHGLTLTGAGTITGMFIHDFPDHGIRAQPNLADEVILDGNVVSANFHGLELVDAKYRVVNNKIGTNVEGTARMENVIGISMLLLAEQPGQALSPIDIGAPGAGNLISGNGLAGISATPISREAAFAGSITRAGTIQIAHNKIGTDIEGMKKLDQGSGVSIIIANNVFIHDNVISGHENHAITIGDPAALKGFVINDVRIEDNKIGVGADAETPVPNGDGIRATALVNFAIGRIDTVTGQVSHGNIVDGNDVGMEILGTAGAIAGNRVSRNRQGMEVLGTGIVIQGNYIGTDAAGNDLGNAEFGVHAAEALAEVVLPFVNGSVIVGGFPNSLTGLDDATNASSRGEGNVIAFNGVGIEVPSTGAVILGNSIHDNDGPGIRSFETVPVPMIASVVGAGGLLVVDGSVTLPIVDSSEISPLFGGRFDILLQFYANNRADPSGLGEGRLFVGKKLFENIGPGETVAFNELLAVPDFDLISATATFFPLDRKLLGPSGTESFTSGFSATVRATPDVDTDLDGVNDRIEDANPNPIPEANGQPPSQVANVTSTFVENRTNSQSEIQFATIISSPEGQNQQFDVKTKPIEVESLPVEATVVEYKVKVLAPGAKETFLFHIPRTIASVADSKNFTLIFKLDKNDRDSPIVLEDLPKTDYRVVGGDAEFIFLEVSITDGGPFDEDGAVNSEIDDPLGVVFVPGNDLVVTKQLLSEAVAGRPLTYRVSVENDGDSAAPVVLTETVPAGATLLSATPSQGSLTRDGDVVTIDFGNVPAGTTVTLDVTLSTAAATYATQSLAKFGERLRAEINPTDNTADLLIDVAPDPEADSDLDGVLDRIEVAGPNGGDANNDGQPDSRQDNVASFPSVNNGPPILVTSSPETTLKDVAAAANPAPDQSPGDSEFPFGFIHFTATVASPGSGTAVTIRPPAGASINSFYKFGPEPQDPATLADETVPHFYEFLLDPATNTGAEFLDDDGDGRNDRVMLHLVDGGRGDADLTANGVIVDPGALASVAILVASGGGPYQGDEGASIRLSAAGTTNRRGDLASLDFAWDFDGDGQFDDATGIEPDFTARHVAGDRNLTVAVRVRDSARNEAIAAAQLTVVDAFAFTNPRHRLDVDDDGSIAPLDVLVIINELNSIGARGLIGSPPLDHPSFFDVNSDRFLAPVDALLVINHLNGETSGEGESSGESQRAEFAGDERPPWAFHLVAMATLRTTAASQANLVGGAPFVVVEPQREPSADPARRSRSRPFLDTLDEVFANWEHDGAVIPVLGHARHV